MERIKGKFWKTQIISKMDTDLWERMKVAAFNLKPREMMYEFVAKAIEERLERLSGRQK